MEIIRHQAKKRNATKSHHTESCKRFQKPGVLRNSQWVGKTVHVAAAAQLNMGQWIGLPNVRPGRKHAADVANEDTSERFAEPQTQLTMQML
jgi:hypothetical protein